MASSTSLGTPKPSPQAMHKRALDAIRQLQPGRRATVPLPGGTDAILLAPWAAADLAAELLVVSVPSRDLLAPTLLAFHGQASVWPHATMLACFTSTPGRALAAADLGLPTELADGLAFGTSLKSVTAFLAAPAPARLVLTTHDSVRVVAAALQRGHRQADLFVCDHAHTLAGQPVARFRTILDDARLPARRRIYLGATPVESTAWLADADPTADSPLSLTDRTTFGRTIFSATRTQAIAEGILVPTNLEVLTPSFRGASPPYPGVVDAILAAAAAGSRAVLTLHSCVRDAERLVAKLDALSLPGGSTIRTHRLEPRDPASHRAHVLAAVATSPPDVVTVVATASTLVDGIDVPGFDAVILADPRPAPAAIAAAVAASAKPAPGRRQCRVVLPIRLPAPNHDVASALAASPWREPWLVLRALATRDVDVATTRIRSTAHARSYGVPPSGRPAPLRIALPVDSATPWALEPIQAGANRWGVLFNALRAWTERTGYARPRIPDRVGNLPIGTWRPRQCRLHADGLLLPHQTAALESLFGWAWTPEDVAWWHAAGRWRALHDATGPWTDDAATWQALAATPGDRPRDRTSHSYATLADFASDTCARRRQGTLPPHLERAAEHLLPGWRWDFISDADHTMLVALAEYAAFRDDFNVPHDYVHVDESPLGAWLTALRRRRLTGRLAPALAHELELLERRRPQATPLDWDEQGTLWRLSYIALHKFSEREGTCRVPPGHVEALPDFAVDLSDWSALQHAAQHAGALDDDQVAALEQLPDSHLILSVESRAS